MLKKCLPQTGKLMIVGWRATDKPFVELLSKHLRDNIFVQIVCGSKEDGKQVEDRFGFSSFIRSDDARTFLGTGDRVRKPPC
jgi:hypothetical protein